MSARHRILLVAALFAGILCVGTLGYRLIEGWPWFDSLYHTVITLSTVGYKEVHPLSRTGQWFTVFLILGSFAGLALAVQALTRLVVEGELRELYWRRRMARELSRVRDHVIVCGYGSMGRLVAEELEAAGWAVVVIDNDPERVAEAVADNRLVVDGDATSDEVLQRAGVVRAATAVSALSSDAANVFATLSLRVLNPKLTIISRHDGEDTREKLVRAGADQVVSPKLMGGHRVVNCVLRPAATQLLDKALRGRELDLRMDELVVLEGSELIGQALQDLRLRESHGVLVVAIRKADGDWLHAPGPAVRVEGGDTVVVIGLNDGVHELLRRESVASHPGP